MATQPPLVAALDFGADTPARQKFLARLQGEIATRGVIDVLRRGLRHGPHEITLFYGSPSPGNPIAAERFAQNRFGDPATSLQRMQCPRCWRRCTTACR